MSAKTLLLVAALVFIAASAVSASPSQYRKPLLVADTGSTPGTGLPKFIFICYSRAALQLPTLGKSLVMIVPN